MTTTGPITAEAALTEQSAIEQARTGDRDAFRVLVDRHSRNVYRLAFRMTGNHGDADDVVQETFLRAFRQIRTYDGRAGFGTWLYCIAANYSRDVLRARRRRATVSDSAEDGMDLASRIPSDDPSPDRIAFGRQLQGILAPALASLSEMERSAFLLRHYEGLSTEQIAEALGVQPGAAKHSVFRAVQKLRRVLEPVMK
jgi:RNA polymerase sigma-70 factor (ECF subfamily)